MLQIKLSSERGRSTLCGQEDQRDLAFFRTFLPRHSAGILPGILPVFFDILPLFLQTFCRAFCRGFSASLSFLCKKSMPVVFQGNDMNRSDSSLEAVEKSQCLCATKCTRQTHSEVNFVASAFATCGFDTCGPACV